MQFIDLLGTVRLKLERDTSDAALIQNLQEIATLASLFSQLRDQSSHTVWSGFIDELDSEGTLFQPLLSQMIRQLARDRRRTLEHDSTC